MTDGSWIKIPRSLTSAASPLPSNTHALAIVTYTGEQASVVFNALFSKYCDASKGEHIDMVKVSIIDPLKLVHAALIVVSRTQPSY